MKVRNSHVQQTGCKNIPAEGIVWVTGLRWKTDLKEGHHDEA